MTNQWANLSNQQKNEYGKSFAKSEFIKHGFKIKDAPQDLGHIDFVAENTDAAYDVVVKTVSDFNYQYIVESKFRNTPAFIVALVRVVEDNDALLYVFRGDQWPSPDGLLTYKRNENKDYEAEYGINFAKKRESVLSNYTLRNNLTATASDSDAATNSQMDTEIDLKSASEAQRADRDIVLAAVSKDGWALRYASKELRADHDVVLAAVSDIGQALEYASDELRSDRDIVLAAVKRGGSALKYASDELRADRDVVLAALVYASSDALAYASGSVTGDLEVLDFAIRKAGHSASCIFGYVTEKNDAISQLAKKVYFDNDPPQCFLAVSQFLEPTPDVLDRAFGCHDFDSFDKETAVANSEDYETEKFEDMLGDYGIFEMSVGDKKTVGCGMVEITCWHILNGEVQTENDTHFSNRLYFYILEFQAETLHAVCWVLFEFEDGGDGTTTVNDRYFRITGSHGDGPISENDYCSELLEHLEEDSDSDSGWEEESD